MPLKQLFVYKHKYLPCIIETNMEMNMYFYSDYSDSNRQLITSLPKARSPIVRLNTICPYFTMYPLDFPFNILERAQSSDWVLDPFSGRGTTNFAARMRGIASFGIDSSPIACAISAAKFVNTTPIKIIKLYKAILKEKSKPNHIPHGKFWDLCYHSSTLSKICVIRETLLDECVTDEAIALRALMLGILHGPTNKNLPSYLSNQMPRTYSTKPDYSIRYWEKNRMSPVNIDVLDVVSRRAKYSFNTLPPISTGGISLSDARKPLKFIPDDGFNWVITSPPYFGMKTYLPDQWLRNWFLGGPDSIDYSISNQLSHGTKETFIGELSKVWKNITKACAPNAQLIIRFGSLPSKTCNPLEILQKSIDLANCGWEHYSTYSAGTPKIGRRQSEQFGDNMGTAQKEIDYYAVLT